MRDTFWAFDRYTNKTDQNNKRINLCQHNDYHNNFDRKLSIPYSDNYCGTNREIQSIEYYFKELLTSYISPSSHPYELLFNNKISIETSNICSHLAKQCCLGGTSIHCALIFLLHRMNEKFICMHLLRASKLVDPPYKGIANLLNCLITMPKVATNRERSRLYLYNKKLMDESRPKINKIDTLFFKWNKEMIINVFAFLISTHVDPYHYYSGDLDIYYISIDIVLDSFIQRTIKDIRNEVEDDNHYKTWIIKWILSSYINWQFIIDRESRTQIFINNIFTWISKWHVVDDIDNTMNMKLKIAVESILANFHILSNQQPKYFSLFLTIMDQIIIKYRSLLFSIISKSKINLENNYYCHHAQDNDSIKSLILTPHVAFWIKYNSFPDKSFPEDLIRAINMKEINKEIMKDKEKEKDKEDKIVYWIKTGILCGSQRDPIGLEKNLTRKNKNIIYQWFENEDNLSVLDILIQTTIIPIPISKLIIIRYLGPQ